MSVYQVQGKPLSQQALYQQKLKQGVYNSPSKSSVGVASSASDTAALLAASTDLTVKPSFERLRAAPEAHNAASSVNLQKKPAPVAAPLGLSELGVSNSYNRSSVYKQAHSNSTSTMTSRTTPEKLVGKHGLASKPTPGTTLDISKISQVADKNTQNLINKRFNPGQDHRSGLGPKPTAFLSQEEENAAALSAGRSLTMKHGAGYTDSISTQKRSKTFQAADVVDAKLLAAASAKAQERLSSINSGTPTDVRAQAQLYSKALAAAQKNSEERLKQHNSGMIDLGGGLSLPATEVDRLANLIVQPVIQDMNTKANAQREYAEEQKTKKAELKALHEKAKKEEEKRKQTEALRRVQEKEARVKANDDKKKAEDNKFAEHKKTQETEVEGKKTELKELQAKYASEKEALLTKKKENEERIAEEEAGLIKGRKEELETMQKEKDEILKPTLDELKIESEKLKNLTDTKDQLTSEVKSGEKLKAENEAKIKALKEKLEQTNAKIESTTKEHEEYVVKRETTDKEVKDLQESSDKTLKQVEDSHKELDGEIEKLTKEKEENISTKATHKKDIHLQLDEKVKGAHEVNKKLPEHLQNTIDETELRDTGSLFSLDEEKKPEKKFATTSQNIKSLVPADIEVPVKKEVAKKEVETPAPAKETVKKEAPKAAPVKKEVKKAESSSEKKGFRAKLLGAFSSDSKPDTKTKGKTAVKSTKEKIVAAPKKVEAKVEKTVADAKKEVTETKKEVTEPKKEATEAKKEVADAKTEVAEAKKDADVEVKAAKETAETGKKTVFKEEI